MTIEKVKIVNYKSFKGEFELSLNDGINVIVGNNEAGKSTILEAIHLALTGIFNGRSIKNELTQYLFNYEIIKEYIAAINSKKHAELPYILIELYFKGDDNPLFEGDGNSKKIKADGVCFKIMFDEMKYAAEYESLHKAGEIKSLPIEYYDVFWTAFSRLSITTRSIPFKSAMIDSSNTKYQNGSDMYISRIIKDSLDPDDITRVSQVFRKVFTNAT